MSHSPFDHWLFEDDLADSQRASLADHLATCPSCRELADSWTAVEAEIGSAGMVQPQTGFVLRWKARQAADRAGVSRWQGVSALGLVFGSTAALVAMRFLGTPVSLVDLTVWLSSVFGTLGVIRTLQSVLWSVAGVSGRPWISALPLMGMAGFALAAATGLLVIWSCVVFRLAWRVAPVRPSVS